MARVENRNVGHEDDEGKRWVGLRVSNRERAIAVRLGDGCITDGIRRALYLADRGNRLPPVSDRLRALTRAVEAMERRLEVSR